MSFFRKSIFFITVFSYVTAYGQAVKLNPIALSKYTFSDPNGFAAKILSPAKIDKIRLVGEGATNCRISHDSIYFTSTGLQRILSKRKLDVCLDIKLHKQKKQRISYTILSDGFSKNKVIAHRGAWKTLSFPPNSMAALTQAFKLQFEGSEFDVHLTADDILVVNHDPDFQGLSIERSTYEQLLQKELPNGEKIPTLEGFLKAGMAQRNTKLILEIKPSVISKERTIKLTEHIMSMVQRLGAQAWINYISFDYDALKRVLQIEPAAHVSYLEGRYSPDQLKKDGISGADYYYTVFQSNENWINRAHKLGLTINAWTVNDPEIMKWLLLNQADYITTNEPEKLLELVKDDRKNDEWELVWSDEFNYTGLPDGLKWNYDAGQTGWGNNEQQRYTYSDTSNAKVKDGILSIIARKQPGPDNYTSARLTTKDTYSLKYGRVEVRAKLPRGKGLWPAIWMLPTDSKYGIWPNSGEIDIAENVGFQPDTIYGSIHTGKFNHLKNTQKSTELQVPGLYDSFHVFRLDWQPESLDFYLDDHKYMSVANTKAGSGEWPFDENFYLLLNVAVGGNWGGKHGIDDTIFPAQMQVDYVRIFKKRESGSAFNNNK